MIPRALLAVASECAPFVKTGGLADVVGALPSAVAPQGWATRTLIPGYRPVLSALKTVRIEQDLPDLLGQPARILGAEVDGFDLLVLECEALFDREGSPYLDAQGQDWADNDLRFAALSKAAALIAAQGLNGWQPELLHLHDWQAGFTPWYLRALNCDLPTVMTIHNMAFHGLTSPKRLSKLELPRAGFDIDGFEFYDHISALKAGLTGASAITTVSPTYAKELATSEFGMGLEGVIQARSQTMHGILNGIDTQIWDPARDPSIVPFKTLAGKAANTRALRREFGLTPPTKDTRAPLCVVISRLSDQKGLDLLLDALPALLDKGGQLALLGSGDRKLEQAWLKTAAAHPGQVAVRIGYDEALSHRMYAGGEAVLVPSRFEPCGLTQLYGLRYGALPVVARTGGLADTVIHANVAALANGCATGFTHRPGSTADLAHTLSELCTVYQDAHNWRRLQRNAMKHPVGWESSAPRYAALYASLVPASTTPEDPS